MLISSSAINCGTKCQFGLQIFCLTIKGTPKWANINQFTYFSPNKSRKMSLIIDFILHEIFILSLEYESMANVDLPKYYPNNENLYTVYRTGICNYLGPYLFLMPCIELDTMYDLN